MIDEKKLLGDLIYCKGLGRKALEAVIEVIKAQPKADWIPCEERLPSEYGQYLYTDKNDEVHEGCYCPQYHGMISGWSTCEATGFTHLSDYEVIAWTNLPQPYKKEGAE